MSGQCCCCIMHTTPTSLHAPLHVYSVQNQSNEQREPKKQRIVKANRQAISSKAHLEKVLKKRLEAKEKKRLISLREVNASVPESQPSTDKTDMVCTDTG